MRDLTPNGPFQGKCYGEAAKYEDGVFKPLEGVELTEGTKVEVYVHEAAERPKSLRELAAFGMWADRDDIPDGVTYVNRLREPRF